MCICTAMADPITDCTNGTTSSANARSTTRGSEDASTCASPSSAAGTRSSRALMAAVNSSCFDGK